MQSLLFMILSSMEFFVIIFFMFGLFQIRLREYLIESVFSSIVMAFFSLSLRLLFHQSEVTPIILLCLLIVFVWLLFRIHLFFAVIMSFIAYAFYALFQTILIAGFESIGIITLAEAQQVPVKGYILQIVTIFLTFILAFSLRFVRIGLRVPQSRIASARSKGNNLLFGLTIAASLIIFVVSYFLVESRLHWGFVPIGLIVALIIVIYYVRGTGTIND